MRIIRTLRKQRGLSQAELAASLGVAQNTLSNYEMDKRSPDARTLATIAEFFGVSVDYLLGRGEIVEARSAEAHSADAGNAAENAAGVRGRSGERRRGVRIPVLENAVPAALENGPPEVAADAPDDAWEEISEGEASEGRFFALRITDASMEPLIEPRDILIMKLTGKVADGGVAAVSVNGGALRVRRVRYLPGGVMLVPDNREFDPDYLPEGAGLAVTAVPTELRRKL